MSQPPSTPVKVPSSAADFSPATLDPDLRSQINTMLLREGHVSKIQDRLLHALNAHPSNWPTVVQSHALDLLRSGQVVTFGALLRRVLDDVRQASSSSSTNRKPTTTTTTTTTTATTNGVAAATTNSNLAVPLSVVEETIRVTRECLESVCEIED